MRVTLDEEPFAGSYVIAEHRDDGTLVLRPENSNPTDSGVDRRIDEIAEGHAETLERLGGD